MINSRNGFTYAANIAMLSFSVVLFIFEKHSLMQFRVLGVTCVLLGIISTFFYVCFIKEDKLSAEASYKERVYNGGERDQMTSSFVTHEDMVAGKIFSWKDWMSNFQFYLVAMIYMFSRVSLNVTATVMPLYLSETLGFQGERQIDTSFAIAAVPLYAYICSMIFSVFGQSRVTARYRSRKAPMVLALLFTTVSSIPLLLLDKYDWCKQMVYPCACM